jgi:hypothetical protein
MSQRPRSAREGAIRRPETKSFILTSEFWVAAAAAAAVFLAGYALDDIAKTTAWRYGVWIAIAYIISRGIAKAGSQRAYQPEGVGRPDDFWDYRRDDRSADGVRNQVDERPASAPMAERAGEPTQRYETLEDGR